ncbi:MAG: hypothetical protein HZA15_04840 [Nitrospirae bacterium]|nr:hypothetical protein [Nitrospirota bacterium]
MNVLLQKSFLIGLALTLFTTSCASTKTLHVWKDEKHTQKLGKTLVIAVAELDRMRDHAENMLAWRLSDLGIEAIASNKVIPQLGSKSAREAIAAKVKELGVQNVVVIRAVSKDEYSQLVPGGVYLVPVSYYSGWNSFYADSFSVVAVPGRAYDAEFFTMVTNIYDVRSETLVWSYLSRTKVEMSREGAINPFIETIITQLERGKLL